MMRHYARQLGETNRGSLVGTVVAFGLVISKWDSVSYGDE